MQAPLDLSAVIAWVESNTNDKAVRFEPGLYAVWSSETLIRKGIERTIQYIHGCSIETARVIACSSWGRYQILGENLYDLGIGCTLDIFEYAGLPAYQKECFDKFLRNRGIAFTVDELQTDRTKREQFITHYNGTGAVDAYWERMQEAIRALSATN
jgi:hypothetical protein